MTSILGLTDPEENAAVGTTTLRGGGNNDAVGSLLELSVVLPARNEERNLPACLNSLLEQSEPGFALGRQWELIVVNDASTDRTREIADAAAGAHPDNEIGAAVRVVDAPPLDESRRGGFTGKNGACWAGAQVARGTWILFTDADTIHARGDLSRSLREADRHGVVLLSYSPRQIVAGPTQRMLMPLIFSELASVYPPVQVNDPTRRVAAANGQFLLVERSAYFDLGGHRAVGRSVLEDVALARLFKRAQRPIRFRYAPDSLSTRMYRTNAEMVEGWTKNLALLMPRPIYLAAWRMLDLLLFFGLPALALGLPHLVGWQRGVILLFWVRTALRFYVRVARSNFSALDVGVSIFGVPLFVFLLIHSTVQHRFRRSVQWKGRTYNPNLY